jgi:integrase
MMHKTSNSEDQPKPQVSSNKQIALMPPGRWRVEGEPGLYLYVSQDGQVRRWIFRFTSPTSKKVTEAGLDMATNVSLAQAKAKAQGMRRQIAAGIDPIQAKRTQRTEQVTFGEVCTAWIEIHKASWKGRDSGSQMRNSKLLLHHHGAPLANVPVAELTPDRIQAALEKLWGRTPLQGRRTLAAWERVLDYAKAKGMRTGDNPCAWRGMFEYRFPKVRATDRGHFLALPYEEVPEFMKELRARQKRGVSAVCLEFVILTAARSGEVLRMRWEEVDWDKCLWTIPAGRMKGGREHTVPLSTRAMEILKLQRQYSHCPPALPEGYVFSGYSKAALAEKAMGCLLRNMKVSATVHGMRSSFRDWAGDKTSFQREHVEACLAHRVGNSVELAYRRQTALEKRRVILQTWAEYCEGSQPRPN